MWPRRTTTEQEVLALIAPLGKVIVMHQLEKNQLLLAKQPSLPSGAIRANTSCSAVVLLDVATTLLRASHPPLLKGRDESEHTQME